MSHQLQKLTNRKNGYSNRKVAYRDFFTGVAGHLIVLKNTQLLLPTGRYEKILGKKIVNFDTSS